VYYHFKQTKQIEDIASELGLLPPKGNHYVHCPPTMLIDGTKSQWIPFFFNEQLKRLRIGRLNLHTKQDSKLKLNDNSKVNCDLRKVTRIRSETINRAIIIVDGFYVYHWNDVKGKDTSRHLIHHKTGGLMCIAGIYNVWNCPVVKYPIKTLSVITCDANSLIEPLDNKYKRMPVVLKPKDAFKWVNGTLDIDEDRHLKEYVNSLELDSCRR